MGTWNYGPFDNDEAADLKADYEESSNTSILHSAFDTIIESQSFEAPEAQQAVAAAQILKRAKIEQREDILLKEKSEEALTRILKDSELKELWQDSPEYEKWVSSVRDLIEDDTNF